MQFTNHRTVWTVAVALVSAALVSSCDSAGAGGNSARGDGSVPSLSFRYLEVDQDGETFSPGSTMYSSQAILQDVSTDPDAFASFFLADDNRDDSQPIEEGRYTVGSFTTRRIETAVFVSGSDSGTAAWAASWDSEADFEALFGLDAQSYDRIVEGYVDVAYSTPNYTIEWEFVTADGDTITGSYLGGAVVP